MGFMDRIKSDHCIVDDFLQKYDGHQMIVLGAGHGAECIVPFLLNNSIDNFRICVSESRWKPNMLFMDKCPVGCFESVLKESNDSWDVFVAYSQDFLDLSKDLKNKYNERIRNVYQFDVIPHFWQGKFISHVDRSFYENNADKLEWLFDELSDQKSKDVLVSFVEQRISGDYSYSDGVLSDYHVEYFDPEIIMDLDNTTLIDCGAYDGKETLQFFEGGINNKFSFVIEPDEDSIVLIKDKLRDFEDSIIIKNAVVSDEIRDVQFESGHGVGSGISEKGNDVVGSITIDSLFYDYAERFNGNTIIKMDIEGTELSALKGAQNFIVEKTPILVVCVYHLKEDLITIPQFIKSINPDYKLYMRRYFRGYRDTVLYAIP